MEILKKPLLTEKVTSQNEKGLYGFIVDTKANKIEIRNAVEKKYGVNVASVRTMIFQGKSKTRYTKSGVSVGRTNKFKKAIVQLAAGEVIDFYA